MKKRLSLILLFFISLLLVGCGKLSTGKIGVIRDEEFGNVYIDLTIDEFNALGFSFGDSVDVKFNNGKTYYDVPYYSGYYVQVGELLCCGYPGYPHVVIARNYGDPTWEEFEMNEKSKVKITLNEKGKYIDTQELFSLDYFDDREKYESDIMFANFRVLNGGSIKENLVYRSASPCDNQHNRASYANSLIAEYGIKFAINLSDNETKYLGYKEKDDFVSYYYDDLYKENNVLFLALNANYHAQGFAKAVSGALYKMTKSPGPTIIHCVEGKDRTGFLCALVLALAKASASEIIDDYMITYYNYYSITKDSDPKKYEAILGNVYDFLYCMCEVEKGADVEGLDLFEGAKNYLAFGGLTQGEIAKVIDYLTK